MSARILILGGGFGGLYTALEANRRLRGAAEITLIDRNEYFLYTPLLHQIVSEILKPHHLARPLRRLLPKSVNFVQTRATGVEIDEQIVETEAGRLPYDYLVVALGSVPNFFNIPSVQENAFQFKWLPDALRLHDHLLDRFQQASEDPGRAPDLLRTVITGAGCTGIELVTELHDWMRGPLLRRFPQVPKEAVHLLLVEALEHLLCPMDPVLMKRAAQELVTREIDARLGTLVKEVGPDWARLRHGDEERDIPSGTVVWAAGIKPNPLLKDLPLAFDPRGRIVVNETLQVPGHENVLAIGDLAAFPDAQRGSLAPTAQVAVQQAPAAARVLGALIEGREPEPFRFKRLGEVVDVGHSAALTDAFGGHFSGYPGWLLGRTIHLAKLPDWGDRATVAWEWAKQTLGAGAR
jgi:NADH dehydrogenase